MRGDVKVQSPFRVIVHANGFNPRVAGGAKSQPSETRLKNFAYNEVGLLSQDGKSTDFVVAWAEEHRDGWHRVGSQVEIEFPF
jgi:hypothetical protein